MVVNEETVRISDQILDFIRSIYVIYGNVYAICIPSVRLSIFPGIAFYDISGTFDGSIASCL